MVGAEPLAREIAHLVALAGERVEKDERRPRREAPGVGRVGDDRAGARVLDRQAQPLLGIAGIERQERAGAAALILNIARPARLRFVNDSALLMRKVQISAPRPWLAWLTRGLGDRSTALKGFLARHLAHVRFRPSPQVVRLAEQLAHPPAAMQDEMRVFYREARGIEIVCAACAVLSDRRGASRLPAVAGRRQSERVRDHILAHLDEPLTIGGIARAVGASESTVQRRFKAEFGVTVFAFIRERRFEHACRALQQDGASIAQAAHIAGYADSAHFSTAFKRAYGISPSRCRGQIAGHGRLDYPER